MTGSLQIKGKYYYAVLNFYDTKGKRINRWIPTKCAVDKNTKRKAEKILNQLVVEYEGHEIVDDSKNFKVSDFAWEWLRSKEDTIEESTYDSYYSNVQHIEQFFGKEENQALYIEDLTCDIIGSFYQFLLKSGKLVKRKNDKDPGLSRKYVCEIAKNLRSMLDYAHDKKVIFVNKDENPNPAKLVKVPKKREDIKEYTFLDADDSAIFLKAIKGHILEVYFIISLFYGLRRSEALGLEWKAINLKKRVLVIKRTIVRNRRRIEKDRTKNGESYREYPIPDFIYNLLIGLQKKQQENRRLFGDQYHNSDYVFTWDDGRPFTTDYPTKAFKKIVKSTEELDGNLRLHDLRASCVTLLAQEGYTLKEIQKWVGHAENSEETLKVYMRAKSKIKSNIGSNLSGKFSALSSEQGVGEQTTNLIRLPA